MERLSMGTTDHVENADAFFNLFQAVQTETEDIQPTADISIYHDMGQVGRRIEKLLSDRRKAGQDLKGLLNVLAEKNSMLGMKDQNRVQLEREIESISQKIQELGKYKEKLNTAAFCCQMYGIFGLDYSVLEGRLYYKGEPVKIFSDTGSCEDGEKTQTAVYENPKGRVSVMAKRGRTGSVLYLKIYE